MKALLGLILMVHSVVAEAATFEPIRKFTDRNLQTLHDFATTASNEGFFGDCGRVGRARIVKKSSSESLVNSIKQFAWTDPTERIFLELQDSSTEGIIEALSEWYRDPSGEEQLQEAQNLLRGAVEDRLHMRLYSGTEYNDLVGSRNLIAIVDLKNKEIFLMGDGSCH